MTKDVIEKKAREFAAGLELGYFTSPYVRKMFINLFEMFGNFLMEGEKLVNEDKLCNSDKKVYVLLKESYTQKDKLVYDTYTDVYLFKTLEKAQEKMVEIYNQHLESLKNNYGEEFNDMFETAVGAEYSTVEFKEYFMECTLDDNLYLFIKEKDLEG